MDFPAALRDAVHESGLTLERIRHRLARRGLTVSVATLSHWQRGRTRPRSRPVVAALEEILGVEAGTLTARLDDPAPDSAGLWPDPDGYTRLVAQFDRSGDRRLERLSVHDVHRLGPDRRAAGLTVREVLRSTGDDVDRVVCVHPVPAAGAELTGLRYCRPGRVRGAGGLLGFELIFDRVLGPGETAVVEYGLRPSGPGGRGGTARRYRRVFPRPVRDYLAIVQFDPAVLPARCYGFTGADGRARHPLGELWIGTSGSAHLALADVRRGVAGLEWEWD
ncbi:helix-turn-helix domain-containing protein [Actinomadura rayongensis]|uniref:XRE family transcriptional regulator n=1 Tax=Actinomadura rayongensis TaxID=1429076 RepID=A0A6I4W259_9ACTN|nr:XRE family transcriptional regulator [Actinomadura rayongensis]MXQ63563.1 XRE family transcriptional regulator [Actinomadura rayongensis]